MIYFCFFLFLFLWISFKINQASFYIIHTPKNPQKTLNYFFFYNKRTYFKQKITRVLFWKTTKHSLKFWIKSHSHSFSFNVSKFLILYPLKPFGPAAKCKLNFFKAKKNNTVCVVYCTLCCYCKHTVFLFCCCSPQKVSYLCVCVFVMEKTHVSIHHFFIKKNYVIICSLVGIVFLPKKSKCKMFDK